jgi:hypothetical protein
MQILPKGKRKQYTPHVGFHAKRIACTKKNPQIGDYKKQKCSHPEFLAAV